MFVLHLRACCKLRHLKVQQAVANLTGTLTLFERVELENMCLGDSSLQRARYQAVKEWQHHASEPVLEQWVHEEMCAHTPPFQPGMEAKEGTPLWSLLKLLWMQKKMLCTPQEPICYCLSKLVFMPAGCTHQSTSSSQALAMLNFQWCAHCAICSRCYGYLVCKLFHLKS